MPFALGLAAAAALLWAGGAFPRMAPATLKAWAAAAAVLAALGLAALLVLTGRGAVAAPLPLFAVPLAWKWWQAPSRPGPGPSRPGSRMARSEAYAVLGLPDGAPDSAIQAAWIKLMRAVHPDGGGTDWLAARVNQARDVLLRR